MKFCAMSTVATVMVAGSTVASAATWSYYGGGDAGFNALTNNGALERGVTEARIGNNAVNGQWESAIWQQGAVGSPQTQDQFVFGNSQATSFSIAFDGANTVTFNLGGTTQTWTGMAGGFTDIFVRVRATETSSVLLSNLALSGSGLSIGDLSQSGLGVGYIRINNASDFGAFTLSGTATLAWSDAAPSGTALAFQTKLARVIPTPGSLALMGVAGLIVGRRRR